MRRILVAVLGLALVAPSALAKGKKDKDKDEDDEEEVEESSKKDKDEDEGDGDSEDGDSEDGDSEDGGGGGDDSGGDDEGGGEGEGDEKLKDETVGKELPPKQNLSGHDMGTNKKENLFEKDRFFVDKVDTEKTQNGTLIQGSIASSSFLFAETGGPYALMEQGENAARFSRVFTELRLQTDFRHIAGGRWEARVDARARVVNSPDQATPNSIGQGGSVSVDPNRVQSGFNGTNEYDVRELWLFRSGKRSDIFFGRQFVPDLGGVKFDGLRIDYASSRKLTFIGFGGLYPLRGSRSISTDYQPLKRDDGNDAGRFVGAGGFGGAYRTINAYGAVGGVALVPFAGEQPRFFVTGTGYWRRESTLDIYHFGLVDLYGSQGAGLTNLSVGANYKPNPRLRLTGAINRVDVDTLAVQANAFLQEPDPAGQNVQNETFFRRLATNTARASVSAGLGEFQRFEVTIAAAYRYRPGVNIPVPTSPAGVNLQGNRGAELFGAIVDRRSIKNLRLGLDATRTFGLGGDTAIAFNRSTIIAVRVFAARELENGHGEWEAEIAYSNTRDSASSTDCMPGIATSVFTCYGSSTGSIYSLGGSLYYRINRDWMALGSLFLTRQSLMYYGNSSAMLAMPLEDPTVTGLTGYGRIAYRF